MNKKLVLGMVLISFCCFVAGASVSSIFIEPEYYSVEKLRHYVYVNHSGYKIPFELDQETNTYNLYYAFYYDNETDMYYMYKAGNVLIYFWDFEVTTVGNSLMPKGNLSFPLEGDRELWICFDRFIGIGGYYMNESIQHDKTSEPFNISHFYYDVLRYPFPRWIDGYYTNESIMSENIIFG